MPYDPKTFWNARSEAWKGTGLEDEFGHLLNGTADILKQEDSKILEIGPGDGHTFLKITDMFGLTQQRYKMCDISEGMIAKCKEMTGVKPDLWNGKKLRYKDGRFDLVLLLSVLLHVPPADIEDFFAECVRVMSNRMFITTWSNQNEPLQSGPHCFQHDYYDLFEKHNLEIIDEQKTFRCRRRAWLLKK